MTLRARRLLAFVWLLSLVAVAATVKAQVTGSAASVSRG